MRQLGEFLQKERESRGVTLQDISLETKIRLDYLEAIEKGEFDKLPGEFYARTYLRTYAKTIGLSEALVVEKYEEIVSKSEAQGEKESLPTAKKWDGTLQKTVVSMGQALKINRIHIVLTVVLVLLIASLAIYFIWKANFSDKGVLDMTPDNETETEEKLPEVEELVDQNESPDYLEPLIEEESIAMEVAKDYSLTLRSHGECWYEILETGQLLQSGVLKNREEIVVKSQGLLQITLGRPRVVSLLFNDKEINLENDVRELTIDSSGEITILKRW